MLVPPATRTRASEFGSDKVQTRGRVSS